TSTITRENFFILINFVISKEERSIRVEEIFEQQEIVTLITEFDKYELALLCHHVLAINIEQFSQDVRKQLSNQLKEYYTPHWELDLTIIDRGFRELYLTEISVEFEPAVRSTLLDLIHLLHHPYYKPLADEIELGLEFGKFSFETLGAVIDVLYQIRVGLDWDKYEEIFGGLNIALENIFVDRILHTEGSEAKRVALSFLLLNLYLGQDREGLISAQDQLDDLWAQVSLSPKLMRSQRYIFLSYYAIITQRFVQDTTSLVIRRNLIQSIINRYRQDMTNYSQVINTIFNTQKLHPWVFDKIVIGFEAYTKTLFEYVGQLPVSREKIEYTHHLENVTDQIYRLIVDYLSKQYSITHPRRNVEEFLDGLSRQNLGPQYLDSVYRFIVLTNKVLLLIKKEKMYQEQYQYRLELWLKTLKLLNEEELTPLYEVDILMLTNQYPFGPIMQMIEQELAEGQSILASKTFEDRIIKVITATMDHLATRFDQSNEYDNEAYEILLSFTCEWLHYFSLTPRLFNDANAVLSAIVIVSLSHLSQSYFRSKKIEKAFLMYLNLFFFSEYLNQRVYTINVYDDYGEVIQNLPEKFLEMTEGWNFRDLIDLDFIGKSAKNLELSINNSVDTRDKTSSNMLQDDLLFGYLDLADALESFLTKDMTNLTGVKILNIDQFEVYKDPDPSALTRMERIGSTLLQEKKHLPFPFIRNVEGFATAMTLTPFNYGSSLINEGMVVDSIISLLNLQSKD
ncbi:MAG: hypothetical protein ACXAE3_05790, partial [Candidatus Kariarchaeaceae archaeon]